MTDRPPPSRPSLLHPLTGANPFTLARVVFGNGWIPPSRWPHVFLAGSAALGRQPFTWFERGLTWLRKRITPPMADPVFIVGHWRSGTTHLHNLLNCSPRWGFITPLASGLPWEILTIGTWLRPLLEGALPEDRYVDNVAVTPVSPQEDEIPLANMQSLSVFHANYFPRHFARNFYRSVFFDGASKGAVRRWQRRMRYFLEKIALHQKTPRLLIKNPVYTARLAMLREMFPYAKFVHIYRNPYVVFRSTVHYYKRLLPELALQSFAALDIPQFVEESYVRVMQAYDGQAPALPPNMLAEVRFEDLEDRPLDELRRIYEQLDLGDFAADEPQFRAYLATLGGYKKNRYDFDDDHIMRVERSWQPWVARWNYRRPS